MSLSSKYTIIFLGLTYILSVDCYGQVSMPNFEIQIPKTSQNDNTSVPKQSASIIQPQIRYTSTESNNNNGATAESQNIAEQIVQTQINGDNNEPKQFTASNQQQITNKYIASNFNVGIITEKPNLGEKTNVIQSQLTNKPTEGVNNLNIQTKGFQVETLNAPSKSTAATQQSIKTENIEQSKLAIQSEQPRSCGAGMVCVPHRFCNEPNTDSIIDLHIDLNDQCHYLETCCSQADILTESNVRSSAAAEQWNGNCGYRNFLDDPLIVPAQYGESRFGEFPWMVAIFKENFISDDKKYAYICGGAVIAPNVVLTAAHCVYDTQPELLTARAGEWDTKTTLEVLPHQDARIKDIFIHEQFNNASLINDIALLTLATPYQWADNVRPICLPTKGLNFENARCYATGWGKERRDGAYSEILKKIDLPIISRDTCLSNLQQTRLGKHFQLHESLMCAGGEEGKDTCKGDGGSPLVCPDPDDPKRFYQVGIVAWGINCGAADVPGVYANVPYFNDWLKGKLANVATIASR